MRAVISPTRTPHSSASSSAMMICWRVSSPSAPMMPRHSSNPSARAWRLRAHSRSSIGASLSSAVVSPLSAGVTLSSIWDSFWFVCSNH